MAFNSTPFHGKICQVEKNNVKMSYGKGWNLSVNLDMADITASADAWKTALPGMAGWSGSFEAYFVAGNTEQKAFFDNLVAAAPGTKLTDVKFLLDADANAFTGDIYITGMSVAAQMGGIVTATINFQGDGALSLVSNA
jgi:predicted secreted protein